MDYKTFITNLSKQTSMSRSETESLLQSYVTALRQLLTDGHTVSIKGLGYFDLVQKTERKMYNPTTKKYTIIPQKMSIKFRPSTSVKNMFKDN